MLMFWVGFGVGLSVATLVGMILLAFAFHDYRPMGY